MDPRLVYHRADVLLGYHIKKLPSLTKTFESKAGTPLRAYQLYLGNSRSWKPSKVDIHDIMGARNVLRMNNKYVCVHASLIYNLAGATNGEADPNYYRNIDYIQKGITTDLDITAGMGGGGVVVHIGSRVDREEGIRTIVNNITTAMTSVTDDTKKIAKAMEMPVKEFMESRRVILENSAGQGTMIGSTLEEIAEIIDLINSTDDSTINFSDMNNVKVCIDTAHAFAAELADFGTPEGVENFYQRFGDTIGLDRLEVFHLNDSRVAYGSGVDRHENLNLGHQFTSEREDGLDGLNGLKTFVDYAVHHSIPFIGEPPDKTKDKLPAPGGKWDYEIIKKIYDIEKGPGI